MIREIVSEILERHELLRAGSTDRQYSVRRMCHVVEVSPSGYYAWCSRPESARGRGDCRLRVKVREVFPAEPLDVRRTWRSGWKSSPVCHKSGRRLSNHCSRPRGPRPTTTDRHLESVLR